MVLVKFMQQQFSERQFFDYQLPQFGTFSKPILSGDVNGRIAWQKIFNRICKEEINALAKIAKETNIQIAFMKGLVLAEDVYAVPEKRFFGDIDLLVNLSDLKKFLKKCETLGYTFLFMETDETIEKGIVHSADSKMHHYHELSKTINLGAIQIEINIDVHTQVYSQSFHQIKIPYASITTPVLSRSILFDREGFENVYILNRNDDLIAMVLHTVKHFFENVMASMKSYEYSYFFKMRDLLDVDLFIEKYNIDYIELIEQAIKWDAVSELVFIFKIIESYKPNEFEKIDLDEIYKNHRRQGGFVASSINLFMTNFDNLFDLLLLPSWDLAKFIVDNRSDIEYPTILSYKGDDYKDLSESCFTINEQSEKINNKLGTHHKVGRQIEQPDYWHCHGTTRWTDDHLFFKLKVDSSYALNLKADSHKGWAPSNSIDFYFLKPNAKEKESFIKQIEIPLQIYDNKDNSLYGEPFIKVFDMELKNMDEDNRLYKQWDDDSFVSDFKVYGNDYILEVGFKLDILKDCIINNELICDIAIVAFDDLLPHTPDNNPPRRTVLSWASTFSYSDFHDITNFGRLKLINRQ